MLGPHSESVYYGVYEANRPELAEPYYKAVLQYAYARGHSDAVQYVGISNSSLTPNCSSAIHFPGESTMNSFPFKFISSKIGP